MNSPRWGPCIPVLRVPTRPESSWAVRGPSRRRRRSASRTVIERSAGGRSRRGEPPRHGTASWPDQPADQLDRRAQAVDTLSSSSVHARQPRDPRPRRPGPSEGLPLPSVHSWRGSQVTGLRLALGEVRSINALGAPTRTRPARSSARSAPRRWPGCAPSAVGQLSPTAKSVPSAHHPTGLSAVPPAAQRFDAPGPCTPRHLAEKILTSRRALEGERKQVTVLFADLKGSMELLAHRDPEEAEEALGPRPRTDDSGGSRRRRPRAFEDAGGK